MIFNTQNLFFLFVFMFIGLILIISFNYCCTYTSTSTHTHRQIPRDEESVVDRAPLQDTISVNGQIKNDIRDKYQLK
jgi:hypothetical protein